MLMSRGTRISLTVVQSLNRAGGANYKEFNAIDLTLKDIFISVPFGTKMSNFSPFEITLNERGEYTLCWFGTPLTSVDIRSQDPIGNKVLNSGFRYNELTYLGHDRLRVFHRHSCYYKQIKTPCKFCDIDEDNRQFSFDDVKIVIDEYVEHHAIAHYLIGGGSNSPDCDFSVVMNIAAYIRSRTDKPICLMSVPPLDVNIFMDLHNAGITGVAFNLEVYDRELAVKYMQGKGKLTLLQYETAFKQAVRLWGKDGMVRSIFIVGLESKESLLNGVEFVARLGVWPILSLLKPEGTSINHLFPPSEKEVYEICIEVENICKNYGVGVAPVCRYCEDNTLKITTKE
jgi:hypothetical protein